MSDAHDAALGHYPEGPEPDPIREAEIEKTRKALRRHEANVSRMHDAVRASGGCCPACAFGSEYDKAATKVHRVETWLAHLLEKEKPLKRERPPCDHAWALRAICVALGLPEDETTGNIVRAVDSAVECRPGPVCPTCEAGGWPALVEAERAKTADVMRRLAVARARVKELEATPMTCDHCFGRGHSPILRQPENDYSEHSMPDDPYYCACERGRALRAFADANLPPPARVTETPEVETAPEVAVDAPEPDVPDVHGLRNYGCDLRGLLGPPDLAKVEANVTAALSEAFAPFGFNAEWRVDRSKPLDGGTIFGVMRIEPRRPR